MIPVGVKERHSGRLATADADLPSLPYEHLVAGPRALLSADCKALGAGVAEPKLVGRVPGETQVRTATAAGALLSG